MEDWVAEGRRPINKIISNLTKEGFKISGDNTCC